MNDAVGIEMGSGDNQKRDGRRNYRSVDELGRIRTAFVEWVQHILDQKNWTPTDLANHSDLAPSTLLRIMNSKTHPFNISFMTIRKVADGSGYPIPRSLMEASGVSEHSLPREELAVKPRTGGKQVELVSNHQAPQRSLTIRHVSMMPTSLVGNVPSVGEEPCPPQLMGDNTAFAVRMPNDSLSPIVKKNMMLFCTKTSDPEAGDILVVWDKEGAARVRLVESVDEDGIHLEQLNPERKNDVIAFNDIGDFGVVVGVWRR
jgi:SOS-response transcriptional repressor LexA